MKFWIVVSLSEEKEFGATWEIAGFGHIKSYISFSYPIITQRIHSVEYYQCYRPDKSTEVSGFF